MTVAMCTASGLAVLVAVFLVMRAIVKRGVPTGGIRRLSEEEMNRSGISPQGITRLSRAQQETLGHPRRQRLRG